MIVIYEQNYDIVTIYDLIEDDKFGEYCKHWFDTHQPHNEFFNYQVEEIPIIRDWNGGGGTVDWKFKMFLKSNEELTDKQIEEVEKYQWRKHQDGRNDAIGFEFHKFENINNFKKQKNG
jgi:hypothetical protein